MIKLKLLTYNLNLNIYKFTLIKKLYYNRKIIDLTKHNTLKYILYNQ